MGFSPRIVALAHQLGAAVVLSLHDFYFACPRIHLRKTTGELCDGPDFGRECASACFARLADSSTIWGLRTAYFRRTLVEADAVIAYSEFVSSYFTRFAETSNAIPVIPNGVPPELMQVREMRLNRNGDETFNIAYCGTVAAHKGPHVILDALRFAALKRVNVLLIGDGPERDYTRKLRERAAGIRGVSLKFYGKYERRELPFLLRDMDCVVMPSLVPEAGPIVPREALACGVPVIAAKLGALPEVIREGENGFMFDPGRPEDLSAIFRAIAGDPSLLSRLRAGTGTPRAITLGEHAARVCKVYEQALQHFGAKTVCPQEASELRLLHNSLVRFGCDSTRVQTAS